MKFQQASKLPRRLLWAMLHEGVETGRMMHVFVRYGSGKLSLAPRHRHPSSEELRGAGAQLKDVPRTLLFLVVVLTPIPGFVGGYALLAITAEKWSGNKFKVLPTRLRALLQPELEPETPQIPVP